MDFKDIEGKTIQSAVQCKRPTNDDDGWLVLRFTDGTECTIVAYYGGFTGESEDEYPTGIGINDNVDGLIPVSST